MPGSSLPVGTAAHLLTDIAGPMMTDLRTYCNANGLILSIVTNETNFISKTEKM
jgi:hypothetical protein